MDAATTGRLEVTLYANTKDDSGDGELVHSKAAGGGAINAENLDTISELIKQGLE